MTDTATASRPPARPVKRSSPSRAQARHHLEPNPFEKSFSSGPSDTSERRSDLKADAKISSTSTPPLSTRPGAAYRDRTQSTPKAQTTPGGAQESGSTPKPLLPPVASITSPASEANQYPWAAGLTSSLRSGPLSPAMLAGPQSSHFDPNSFRTGFTPDLSNFKTGLTPLGGSISFPPPSPNTAAFLAAMVNSTSSTSAATITPNTLSALSGNPINPLESAAAVNGLSSQPQNFGGKAVDSHDTFDLAFSRTFGSSDRDGPKAAPPGSKLKASIDNETDSSNSQSVSPQTMQKPLGSIDAQHQQATQAASGLFLLSQAQQEISKRESGSQNAGLIGPNGAAFAAANAPTSLYESTNVAKGAKGGSAAKGGKAGTGTAAGSKRKKAGAAAASQDTSNSANANIASANITATTTTTTANSNNHKKAKTGKKASSEGGDGPAGSSAASTGKRNSTSGEDHDGDFSGDESGDEHGGSNAYGEGGKGHMDDKRKNFLERNRQAALKCRQRKKAWLASLQAKVEYLQNDNENLQNTVGALRNEIMFLKSQLVQAQGGAPPGVPMSMPMGPMGPMGPPHGHGDPHHSMAPPGMPIPAGMGPPHPAYMHPGASGPPQMTQGPHQGGMYAPHAVPRPASMPNGSAPPAGFIHDIRGRPRSEDDGKREGGNGPAPGAEGTKITDQPIGAPGKHEREWSNPGADASKPREVNAAIKV